MHRVSTDKEKNRLYLALGKLEGAEEIAQVAAKIRLACQELKPGFSCLTDLREYELVDETLETRIREIQAFLVGQGLTNVVRVVKKFGTWGHVQFDKSSMNVGYHARHVNSMEEALVILDGEFDKTREE
jgi:hypothetical protein